MQNVYCENASSLAHLRALIIPFLFVLPQISAVLTIACSRFLVHPAADNLQNGLNLFIGLVMTRINQQVGFADML